ncbi:type VI secretion system Vgr family protein [Massilia yuzhufengensis]|uniref:Type VI secretion system secreted protein VgrG n=1 Tax=Massilia yuzhufengensis TaxID=1164594 RepID=A0A1I1W2W5_9BURK|nr:type VI secretion system Vgr family protein [Massilia yuzhufengensis]SFD89451.1 type VI secretion system secreted protein VgrG [Massilia yuzhufengensis]
MGESQVIAVGAALSAFSFASQHNRLMQLDFPLKDGPPAILLPNKLAAHEEVSRGFRFDVEVLSDDPRIPLKIMMGRMVTLSLVREDGSLRYFNGYITEFRFLRTDGGFAFYQMVLEPWLAFARLRKDNRSFHNKNVLEITEETLKHYRQADWHMYKIDDPKLTIANQYNESDYNHLHRRWEALGLHYWYEHKFDGHKLMISDNSFLSQPIDEDAYVISFHDESGSHEDDGIHEWRAIRRIGSGKTTLATFDYKNPRAQRVEASSVNQQGDVFPYEIYEDTGAYGFRLHNDGVQLAARRMDEADKDTQYFEAVGNERYVLSGRTFKLGGHFSAEPRSNRYDSEARRDIEDRYYLILSADHDVSNNYQAGPGSPSHYENRFTCIRQDIRWRPGRNYNSEPAIYAGLHTAIVVGPAGADIHTDGYGRVKLQLHWDRLGTYNEKSSPWIRVMTPAAGSEFGQIRLPRVGEEVAVVYPNGNIDHPLVLGALYNQTNMPPWALPEQQSLAGMRSRELGGGTRGNHLVLDDTKEMIQVQLKSDHQCSQLSLGHITRIEDNAGRRDRRGEGWELRTDGHGVARAAKGLLITTEARQAGRGPIKDMGETSDRLTNAAEQHRLLADVAQNNGAQDAGNSQADVAADLQAQTKAVRGAAAASGSFPELSSPHLVMASPVGIATTSGRDTHIVSERHTAITSGKDVSLVAGTSLFASIRQTFRLFVQKAGMKLIAASGDVDIQALSNSIKLLAKLEILEEANRITISAKDEVVINGGGSYVKFRAGAIEFGTAGSFTAHAATHSFTKAKHMEVASASSALTASSTGQSAVAPETGDAWVEFELVDQDGPIPGERFVLTDPGGAQHCGNVNERGGARIERLPAGRCKVEFPDLRRH